MNIESLDSIAFFIIKRVVFIEAELSIGCEVIFSFGSGAISNFRVMFIKSID